MRGKKRFILWGVFTVITAAGVLRFGTTPQSQRSVLETSQQFTLYSLSPYFSDHDSGQSFHGFGIIGQTSVTDGKLKSQLIAALYRAPTENNGLESACHEARHGIRAVKGRRVVEATICFECRNVYFYENGRRGYRRMLPSSQKLFDKALMDAGVPLSRD